MRTTLETVSGNAGAVAAVPGGAAAKTRPLRAGSATGSRGAARDSVGSAGPRASLTASRASAHPSNGAFVRLAEDGLPAQAVPGPVGGRLSGRRPWPPPRPGFHPRPHAELV